MLGILPGGEAVYIDRRDVDIDSGSKAGITMLHIDAAIHYNGPNAEKLHAMIRLIINNCNGIDGP